MTELSAPATPPLQSPSDVARPALGDFFRYHGWLAPGVRFFRRLRFPAKSACIALAFLVPVILLGASLAYFEGKDVAAARLERQGLAAVRPALALAEAAQARRHAATLGEDTAASQARVKALYDALALARAALPASPALAEAWKLLQERHGPLLAQPVRATPDDTFRAHDRYVDAVLAFVEAAGNGSGLAQDPEMLTHHLMAVAMRAQPVQAENTAAVRTLGELALRSRKLSVDRHDLIVEGLALWLFLDEQVESSYKLVVGDDAALDRRLGMPALDDATQKFRDAIESQLLGAELQGDAKTLGAAGAEAMQRQQAMSRDMLGLLDDALAARVAYFERALIGQAVVVSLFLGLAAYLMLAFYKVMQGGLREVDAHLSQIADGNLTVAPQPWGRDEAAELMLTMGRMQTNLRRIAGQVLDGSNAVQVASREIADASHDLSARTEQAAASLEETSSTMEQIAATARQSSERVAQMHAAVQHSVAAAQRGGEVIRQVTGSMSRIEDASRRIGEIIGTIDGIAFQTNILALNAAVEAARAGEQGRGFAVVAGEVRSLAQRSATAAREIKQLIASAQEQVEAGGRIVRDADTAIGEIVEQSRGIDSLVSEATTAAHEQTLGVAQVGQAVHQLDQSTQQNAALVEQSTAAAGALSEQAAKLAAEVAFFKLK